jgi:hypothetical protein
MEGKQEMSYSDRLVEALEFAAVKGPDLARAIKISPQAVFLVTTGSSKSLTAENNSRAARFLDVDAHWLATGEGSRAPTVSAMALDVAKKFDAVTDPSRRDQLHAVIVQVVELAIDAESSSTAKNRPSS